MKRITGPAEVAIRLTKGYIATTVQKFQILTIWKRAITVHQAVNEALAAAEAQP